jgi:hypothetical protein
MLKRKDNEMKKYCKDCVRWYSTKADQCNIPRKLITKELAEKYWSGSWQRESVSEDLEKAVGGYIYKDWYGLPSKINVNNDCQFYKTVFPKFMVGFFRVFF